MSKFRIKGKKNLIDDLMVNAIDLLTKGDIKNGVSAISELALAFAKAGLGMQSFLNIRTLVIESAVQNNQTLFIPEKVKIAETQLREARNGSKIITR